MAALLRRLLPVLTYLSLAAARGVYVVTLHPHLGHPQHSSLWRSHGHSPDRHVFRAPSSFLLSTTLRVIRRIALDKRVTRVEPLHAHRKSSLLVSARPEAMNRTAESWRNATLAHDLDALCAAHPAHPDHADGRIASDLQRELAPGYLRAAARGGDLGGHLLRVTTLCFYSAGDCGAARGGRRRELRGLLGGEAGLLDEAATEGGRRVLVLRVPQGESLCAAARRLARLPAVVRIERRPLYAVLNAFAAAAAQSGAAAAVAPENAPVWAAGLLGQGEVVGVGDTGVDLGSCYFRELRPAPPPNGSRSGGSGGDGSSSSSGSAALGDARVCDLARSKVVCYYVAAAAARGDDSSRAGGGHGTHVAGTIAGLHAGAGAAFAAGGAGAVLAHAAAHPGEMNGVAPLARIAVNDIGGGGGHGALAAPADVATSPFIAAPYGAAGVRIHSNSWGCGAAARNPRACNMYDPLARSMDEFMWLNKDALIVVAAGNSGDSGAVDPAPDGGSYRDGFYTIGAPATFKNGVAVGATQRGDAAVTCAAKESFARPCSLENLFVASARGPTLDGRVKPDVVFPGEHILSARSWAGSSRLSRDACSSDLSEGVHVISGTSMACPGVAGVLALIRQYYREYNPDTGERGAVLQGPLSDGRGPSGALLKATLLSAARPLRGIFTQRASMRSARREGTVAGAARPEFLEGFGRPQLDTVLRFADRPGSPDLLVFDRHCLGHGDAAHAHRVRIAPGGHLAATLTYTDPPGPVQEAWETGQALVNNLDLAVACAPPAACNASGADLAAASPRDNVERVPRRGRVIASAAGTVATVRVSAVRVVTPEQSYALVVVGRGLSRVPEGSAATNWKPDWQKSARVPAGEEQPEIVGQRALSSLVIIVGVLGAVAVAVGAAVLVYFRWKGNGDATMDRVELQETASM